MAAQVAQVSTQKPAEEATSPGTVYDLQFLEMAQMRALYDLVRRGVAKVEVRVQYIDLTTIPKKPRQRHPRPETGGQEGDNKAVGQESKA